MESAVGAVIGLRSAEQCGLALYRDASDIYKNNCKLSPKEGATVRTFHMPITAPTADSMTNYFAQQMELDANTLSKTIWPCRQPQPTTKKSVAKPIGVDELVIM